MDLSKIIRIWKRHQETRRDGMHFLTDTHFNKYFELVHCESFIAGVFEYTESEYGLGRQVSYENLIIPKAPLFINYDTLEMALLTNDQCDELKTLIANDLTILSETFLVTTASYLKPLCFLLFSKYRSHEGISYVLNNLFPIISTILPYFSRQKCDIDLETLSLPFSISFMESGQFNFNIEKYNSQIENKTYQIRHASIKT